MTRVDTSTYWFLVLLCVSGGIELYSSHSIVRPSNLAEVLSLPLPVRVEVEGYVVSPHSSGSALVFDVENEGRLTCYHRHPSPVFPLFSGDWIRLRARIEATPKGILCVVEEVLPRAPS